MHSFNRPPASEVIERRPLVVQDRGHSRPRQGERKRGKDGWVCNAEGGLQSGHDATILSDREVACREECAIEGELREDMPCREKAA